MRKISSIIIIGICLLGVAFCGQEAREPESDELPSAPSEVSEKFSLSVIAAKLEKQDPYHSLDLLKQYIKGKNGMMAVRHINRVAELHPQPEVREEVVEILVKHYNGHQSVGRRCYRYLAKGYQEKDFSKSSKDIIRQNLHENFSSVSGWDIRLSGMANMQDQLPRLNEVIVERTKKLESIKPTEIPWRLTRIWDAHLAKSRMGDKEEIAWCVSKIKEEIDTNPVFSVSLFDDLGYIRQAESVELLKEYFLSSRKLPPTEVEEPFASYLMPIMQQNLIGFPELRDIQDGSRWFTQEEIKTCRDWVKDQSTFDIRR
ncbi:MAG: hypothetical protein ACYSUS_09515 [Planctomycetota bacterium]|jgi:hypothetical protein